MERYEKTFTVRWADVDANGHMRHSAYADYGADVRVSFFTENGFGLDRLQEVGPVLLREELEYLKEMRLGERFRVDYAVQALSSDGGRWRLLHQFTRSDGKLAARITVTGGWIDLRVRRLVPATPELLALLQQVPRTGEIEELPPLRPR